MTNTSKRCQMECAKQLGFNIDTIPESICDKHAKHSIVSKQVEGIGSQVKQIIRLCDEHFYSVQEAYQNARLGEHHIPLEGIIPKKDQICPCCGEKVENFKARLRFRRNRI